MADKPITFMCRLSRNLGASTSWNPKGMSRPVMGLLYLTVISTNKYSHSATLTRRFRTGRPGGVYVVVSRFCFL
jgi:hypothetical protein